MYKRLTITFTAAERDALDRMARQDTRPVKCEVRALVRAEAERRRLWSGDPEGAEGRARPAGEPEVAREDG